MKNSTRLLALTAGMAFVAAGCDGLQSSTELPTEATAVEARGMAGPSAESYSNLGDMVFDIAATPNGSILVGAVGFGPLTFGPNTIKEIGRHGVSDVTSIPTPPGSPINGFEPIGQRNFYAASGGGDRTVGAGVWRVSQGNERLVADISSFTLGSFDFGSGAGDPGPYPDAWKDQRCEPLVGPFSPGPQTNPYHLAAKNGGEVIVADAANNGVLRVRTNGQIEVVAFMDPPTSPGDDWMVLLEDFDLTTFDWEENPFTEYDLGNDVITCYVEPVPTAVAIGPDGAYYVGELTGNTPQNLFDGDPSPEGLARIWRIERGTKGVRCPSAECTVAFEGLNSIIDMAFGPDGKLYVVEFDRAGSAAALGLVEPAGGGIKGCDLDTRTCGSYYIEEALLPSAITFDKSGNLWLVENTMFAPEPAPPTVRKVDLW